ncbi:MAG: hypothetical protein ACFFAU_05850 [Candidatus Hodarchaeota archaeon]
MRQNAVSEIQNQEKAILAFIIIFLIYIINAIAIFTTHLLANATDMIHEEPNRFGSISNAFTKWIDELDGAYQLVFIIIILVLAYTLWQNDSKFPVKDIVHPIWVILAIIILIIQIEIAFNFIGILSPILAVLNLVIALVLLFIAYYLNRKQINLYEYKNMIYKPNALEYAIIVLAIFLSLPWIFAQFGFYISDFPILGLIFWARQETVQNPEPNYPNAVHIGTHHGTEGFLILIYLFITIVWILPTIKNRQVKQILGLVSGVGFSYGVYNWLEDLLTEQVYKRGWMNFKLPNGTSPNFSSLESMIVWAWIVFSGVVLFFLYIRFRYRTSEKL